jgi:hypothetical protein
MYRVLFAVLSVLLLGVSVVPGPAAAGEYYDDGRYRSYERPYRSDDCCDRRMVRHERTYREDYERPYDSHRYSTRYDRPYYDRPNYTRSYYGYRGYNGSRYYGTSYSSGTIAYNDQPRRFYAPGCRPSLYKVYDDGGGWVWGKTAVCY